jgi:hypothetical protein
VFLTAWVGLGSFWLWAGGSSDCASTWPAGYYTAYTTLILAYLLIGTVVCLGFVGGIFLCVGSGLTSRADYKPV